MIRSKRELMIVLAAAMLLGVVILLITHQRHVSAVNRFHSAEARYQRNEALARDYRSLSQGDAILQQDKSPEQDMTGRVRRAVAAAGLRQESVRAVRAMGGGPIRGTNYHSQKYSITIKDADANDIARFLQIWARNEPRWTVAEMDLSARRRQESFDLTAVLECLYISDKESQGP
ncbi:MAG: hypothetical protein KAS72_11460 [Phycisphaerales bacterium]|nr:hypothetical protein [Phycisphaerales bacterium]